MLPEGWVYEDIAAARLAQLLSPASLESLVEEILATSSVTGVYLDEKCNEPAGKKLGAKRIVFTLNPLNGESRTAIDQLLNGAYGLRARYAIHPDAGAAANSKICRAVAAAIEAERLPFDACCEAHTRASLRAGIRAALSDSSAKVWFDGPTDKAAGASAIDGMVDCTAWQVARREIDRLPERLNLSQQQVEVAIRKGRYTPRPSALDVKGAFFARSGEPYEPTSKRSRRMQIHLMGWT